MACVECKNLGLVDTIPRVRVDLGCLDCGCFFTLAAFKKQAQRLGWSAWKIQQLLDKKTEQNKESANRARYRRSL